jgi:Rv2258c-like winged HTH domain
MTMPDLDQARAEEFAEKIVGILNEGAIALMTSIGYRTGLFDAMAGLPLSTSRRPQIASAANLNERYVREWLGAMVVGKSSSTIQREGRTSCPKSRPPS